jgi:FlaA1/EpsC-like NDP-sugar epimerase
MAIEFWNSKKDNFAAAFKVISNIDGLTIGDADSVSNGECFMPGVAGRVVLVTGAGRGIGRVSAELLASRQARVMAVSRTENELTTLGHGAEGRT